MKNKKYNLQKDLVLLTISMFIVVFSWIAFNIYDAYLTSTIDEVLQMQIIPIDGKFNVNTIENLKKRKIIQPDYSEASPTAETTLPEEMTIEIIEDDNLTSSDAAVLLPSTDSNFTDLQ